MALTIQKGQVFAGRVEQGFQEAVQRELIKLPGSALVASLAIELIGIYDVRRSS